ncbi:DUF726-domain-containing protein [Martensiomyces pterosporus]|nr:DUF726-domain-containing protein [Martensiomyces pterosporus]
MTGDAAKREHSRPSMSMSMSMMPSTRTSLSAKPASPHVTPHTPMRLREYEGFLPRHPSRGHSETSLSVIVPDMPAPLNSAPSALAHKHDRRRDYYTDSSTLEAAMGRSAPDNAGIRYDNSERPSSEATTISLTPTSRVASPTVYQFDNDAAQPSGSSGRAGRTSRGAAYTERAGTRKGGAPLFRRAVNNTATHARQYGDYGPDSRLPRFVVDRLRRSESNGSVTPDCTDGRTGESGRASTASRGSQNNESAMHSPRSSASSVAMQNMLELEEAKLLEAEKKSQLRAIDSILSEEQKIAYVGLVYLLLVDIQDRLNVQFKESQSSTASYMNFSRRVMRNMYAHICISAEEQRMIELLPRHKICSEDMAMSLAAQGDTILVESDQDLAVMHSTTEDLINELRRSSECRSSSESTRRSKSKKRKAKSQKEDPEDVYSCYSMLPMEAIDPEPEHAQEATKTSLEAASSIPPAWPESPSDSTSESSRSSVDITIHSATADDRSLPNSPSLANTGTCSISEPTAQPEGAPVDEADEETLTKVNADQPLVIDVRATLVLDLFLLLLADEVYDGRGRYLLRRLAEALKYPWTEVMRCERRVTRQLHLHDYAVDVTLSTKNTAKSVVKERAHKGKKRRLMIIGLATVGGGLVIGLSAGLLAPAIGAGIGATLGAIGVANTGAFFGSIGGTALITGAATLTGSGLAGRQISRRTRFAEQFEFIPCTSEQQTNLILTVPGWLGKADNGVFSFSTLDPLNGDHCSLLWESDALRRLGSSLRMIVGEVFSITLTQTLQHTVLPSLLGPLSIPMWLAKLGYVLDNPWSSGCELAFKAGPIIADLLLQRVQGQRPVTLVGYSIGGRLIFYALLELARMNAYGIVEDVYLFGAPIVASEEEWRLASSVVGGRFVNAYSTKDWILSFFYRTTNLGRNSIAGLHPISGVNGLENIDVSDEVPGHNAYRELMPLLMKNIGVQVTSTELHDPNEKSGDSEHDREMITELQKAAEMLEEHDKKKKKWTQRWSFWDSGSSSKTSASSPPVRHTAPAPSTAADTSAEVDAAARELAELGIQIKEVEATLPALIVQDSDERSKHMDGAHK